MEPWIVLFIGVAGISVAGIFITLAQPRLVRHPLLATRLTFLAVAVWVVIWGLLIRQRVTLAVSLRRYQNGASGDLGQHRRVHRASLTPMIPWPILLFLTFAGVVASAAWVALANKSWAYSHEPLWARLGYLVLLALVIGGICVWLLDQQS